MTTEARIRATTKYENKTYDKFCLRIRKDQSNLTKEMIDNAAKAAGTTLNVYILEAIRQRMERENGGN
jgi:uncharacterized protein (DUF1778 family)